MCAKNKRQNNIREGWGGEEGREGYSWDIYPSVVSMTYVALTLSARPRRSLAWAPDTPQLVNHCNPPTRLSPCLLTISRSYVFSLSLYLHVVIPLPFLNVWQLTRSQVWNSHCRTNEYSFFIIILLNNNQFFFCLKILIFFIYNYE